MVLFLLYRMLLMDGSCCCGVSVTVTAIRNTEGGLDAVVHWSCGMVQHARQTNNGTDKLDSCLLLSKTGLLEFVSCLWLCPFRLGYATSMMDGFRCCPSGSMATASTCW